MLGRLAQHDLDGLVLVAELADLEAGQHGLQRTAHCLRGDPEGAGAVLVDVELQARHRLEPVVVHVADARALARMTSATSPARRRTSLRSGPVTRTCTGPADRRTVEQPIGLGADAREVLRQHVAHAQQHALARLDRLRHQQQLGEVLVLQLLVERQVEARRAFADEGRDVGDVGILQQLLLEALGLALGLLRRRRLRAATDRPGSRDGSRSGRTAWG